MGDSTKITKTLNAKDLPFHFAIIKRDILMIKSNLEKLKTNDEVY